MKSWFEELDYCKTSMGELVLQRRRIAALADTEVYEVKLNNEYLMSSLFYEAEVALADEALNCLSGIGWDVVVGGLGLGYTAAATLKFKPMRRLIVIEALESVIDWHRRGLVPNGRALTDDHRCEYVHADFFALARTNGFDPGAPGKQFDAVLLDIDHTPDHVLAPEHAAFYTEDALRSFAQFLKPAGIFALWSNEAPNEDFLAVLERVFDHVEGQTVWFDNPLQNTTAANGLYLASL